MADDLTKLFGELAVQVPATPEDEFDFTEELLPVLPEVLVTDRLVIDKVRYRYGGYYQVDMLQFYAEYDTYRHIALLMLATMFKPFDVPIRLDLMHPSSGVKHIIFEYNYKKSGWRGLVYSKPYRLFYSPVSYESPPMLAAPDPLHMNDRIRFKLTNLEDHVSTNEEFEKRNTVWLEGNERAYALLVEYLLNMGRPKEQHGMYEILDSGAECTYLGWWSAEVRFILPNSGYWREDLTAKTPEASR